MKFTSPLFYRSRQNKLVHNELQIQWVYQSDLCHHSKQCDKYW